MPTASEIIAAARSAATLPACERRAMCINRKEQQRQDLARRNRLRTERENLIPPTYCYLPFKDGMKVVRPPETRPTPVVAVLVSSKQNPENLYIAAMVGTVPKGAYPHVARTGPRIHDRDHPMRVCARERPDNKARRQARANRARGRLDYQSPRRAEGSFPA